MTVAGVLPSFRKRGEMSSHKRASVHERSSSRLVGHPETIHLDV
jgi:hypothetical protein